jgi:hypothetical protein
VDIGSPLADKDPLATVCYETISLAKAISKFQHHAIRDKGRLNESKYQPIGKIVPSIVKSKKQSIKLPSLSLSQPMANQPETFYEKFAATEQQLKDSLSANIADRSRACLDACREESLILPVLELVMKMNETTSHKSSLLPHIWVKDAKGVMKEARKTKKDDSGTLPTKTEKKLKKRGPGIANPARQADQVLRDAVKHEREERVAKEEEEYAPVPDSPELGSPILRSPVAREARGMRFTNEVVRFSFEVLGVDSRK